MRRVVVTGLGIISCIGNNQETVIKNLKNIDLALYVHILPNIDRLNIKPVLIGSSHRDLSIGTGFMFRRPILCKLWTYKVKSTFFNN